MWERCASLSCFPSGMRCQNSSKIKGQAHVCAHEEEGCRCVGDSFCECVSGCDTDPCGVAGLTALMSRTPSGTQAKNKKQIISDLNFLSLYIF